MLITWPKNNFCEYAKFNNSYNAWNKHCEYIDFSHTMQIIHVSIKVKEDLFSITSITASLIILLII